MPDEYDDEYPLIHENPMLDYKIDIELGQGAIYAEDQVEFGPDGPELDSFDSSWDDADFDDDDEDDAWIDDPYASNDEEEEIYYQDPAEWSVSAHEEWEDYC